MTRFCRAMLISVCSIAVFMGVGLTAQAQDVNDVSEWVLVDEVESVAPQMYADDIIYCDTIEEVGEVLREGMKDRKKTIEVGYTTTKELKQSIMDEFIEEAFKHTGEPTEGDYLRGHYKSYKASAKGTVWQGVYNWVFTYTVNYTTTAAQEKATDKAVSEMLSELKLEGKDSYHKIRVIYDYMCKNIDYDWEHVKDSSYTIKHTAYAAAVKGTSVCQGYSLLLYRLLMENDIDIRVIEGTGHGEDHSWDIVGIDDLYYYVDTAWDSETPTHDWFLKGSNDFIEHKAKSEYNASSFKKKYPIAKSQYWYHGEHDAEFEPAVTKATFTKAGKSEEKCSVCGLVKESAAIAKVSSVKLSTTAYTYDGKQKTPTVTVKDSKGKKLVKGKDYKVSYASGRKNVGKYSVKITLQGNYTGSKTLYFNVRPKEAKISSLTKGTKSFTVKYSKCTTQTSGYQIQYATSSSFDSAKSVFVNKNTTVSKKISGLKAKKTYYVRVRTYKTVKIDGESVKIYSAWSDKKSVKTK